MKRAILTLLVPVAFGLACSKQEISPRQSETPGSFKINAVPKLPEEFSTRGTLNENKLYNLNILVFNPEDALFTRQDAMSTSGSDELQVGLVTTGYNVADYVVYLAANMGSNTEANADFYRKYFTFAALESDMTYHTRTMNADMVFKTAITSSIDAIPMVGKKKLLGTETVVDVDLIRPVAKVNYNVTLNSALTDVKILGVRFGDVPEATYLWGRDTDLPLTDNEYIISDWFTPANANKSASGTVYLPENRKGVGLGDKSSKTVLNPPAHATYMEILVEFEASPQPGALGKRAYYKVYLGKDNRYNYDVVRNANYDVTVRIESIDNITQDVRVTIPNMASPTTWYKTDGMILHYDGLTNDGRDKPPVTNSSPLVTDPLMYKWSGNTITYPSTGPKVAVTNYTTETAGKRNRWKNIAPATEGEFCLPLYGFTWNETSGWEGDCLLLDDTPSYTIQAGTCKGTQGTFMYDDDRLRPTAFTIEVVIRATPGRNTSKDGCDVFGFIKHPSDGTIGRYVSTGIECYGTGIGYIANTKWNGQNYASGDIEGIKRRIVLQYDGVYLTGWYGRRQVFRDVKYTPGPIVWNTGPVGSTVVSAPTAANPNPTNIPCMFTLGKFYSGDSGLNFTGRIYAFRMYNRILSPEELDTNFDIDKRRFGLSEDPGYNAP